MPHRLVTIAIIAFWLNMTSWLIYREVLPYLAEDMPITQIDLLDEIRTEVVSWTVYKKKNNVEERIGSAHSRVVLNEDKTYDFSAKYHFDKFNLDVMRMNVKVTRMEQVYRVTENGKLKAISAKFTVHLAENLPDTHVEVRGEVEDEQLEPRLLLNGKEQKFIPFGKIDMKEQPSIVNPMLPVNRVRGLRDGKTWKVTLFDASGALSSFIPGFITQSTKVPTLIASVSTDTLFWDKKRVTCYKIEYHEPGKDQPSARTWCRKIDGLVLQQEASRDGMDMTLRRGPN